MPRVPPADKTCVSCGRRIEWRKKWERDWDTVRYCSAGCRRRRVSATDRALEEALVTLLGQGRPGLVVDPEEAVRMVASRSDVPDAADLTEPARRAARRLVASGQAEIVQRGRVVDPSTAKGALGLRRAR